MHLPAYSLGRVEERRCDHESPTWSFLRPDFRLWPPRPVWRDDDRESYRVQAYNFSRWGYRTLVRVGSGEKEMTLMPNPEKIWFLNEYRDGIGNTRTSGDSNVSCGVGDSQDHLERTVGLYLVREDFGVP